MLIFPSFSGNLFNYHAELLNHQNNQKRDDTSVIKQEFPQDSQIIKKEEDLTKKEEESEKSDYLTQNYINNFTDKVFEEAQELLAHSPWIVDFGNKIIIQICFNIQSSALNRS